MAKRTPIERFLSLSDLRKAAEVARFDRDAELGADGPPGKPLTPAQKRAWGRAKRKMGRPKIGKGARRVLISVEASLLAEADAFAKKHHLKRSELFARGVKAVMAES